MKGQHNVYHIENLTDLSKFKADAKERQKAGESTVIHHHSISKECEDNKHTIYGKGGTVIENDPDS